MSDDGWTAWDSFKDWVLQTLYTKAGAFLWTARGKAVVTAVLALVGGAIAYGSDAKHKQEIVLLCAGAVGACALISIWTWIQSRYVRAVNNSALPTFHRVPRAESSGWAVPDEILISLETEMGSVLAAYRELVRVWNSFWQELIALKTQKRYRDQEEFTALQIPIRRRHSEPFRLAITTLNRRLERALTYVKAEEAEQDDNGP